MEWAAQTRRKVNSMLVKLRNIDKGYYMTMEGHKIIYTDDPIVAQKFTLHEIIQLEEGPKLFEKDDQLIFEREV